MKNCVILEIRECSEQVVFALGDFRHGDEEVAKLLTEVEAVSELEKLRRDWPDFTFQIVVLRLEEATKFDRTD